LHCTVVRHFAETRRKDDKAWTITTGANNMLQQIG
jgi:hypothetical protein